MPHPTLLAFPDGFETPRLVVRRYRAGDGAWYAEMALRNRDHLERYETGNPARRIGSAEEGEVLVRAYARDWEARARLLLGGFARETGRFAVQLYVGPLSWDAREFEIGYFADVDHQGRGLVTEAVQGLKDWLFEQLHARRLGLRCDDGNLRSAAVAERCGFVREGHVRENILRDGRYSGTLHYGLLRSDLPPGR